jgi:hypothetical protein
MFDYFSDRARLMNPSADLTSVEKEKERRRRLMSPTFASPTVQLPQGLLAASTGAGSDQGVTEPDTSVRPRLAQPPPPVATAVPQMTEMEKQLQAARLRTAGYRDIKGPAVYDDQGRQISGKPVNNDHGVGGRLLDILREGVIRAGEAYNNSSGDPGQRLMSAIGGGLAGGVIGGVNPAADEQRQRLRNIAESTGEEQRILGNITQDQALMQNQAEIAKIAAQPGLAKAEIDAKNLNTISDSYKAKANNLFERWKALPNFDPNSSDPAISQMVLEARELGIALPKRDPNKEYYGSWSPDGRFAVMEKGTGDTKLAFNGESFQKPTPVGEIPDSMFGDIGLLDKSEVTRNALAELPEDVRGGLQLSPEAERFLSQVQSTDETTGQPYLKYVNPEGGLNESKIVQDAAIGLLQLPAGTQLYANEAAAGRAKSKLARLEQKYANSQKPLRAEIDKLRLLLKGKPTTVATQAIDLYKEAKAKKNQKAINELLRSLS